MPKETSTTDQADEAMSPDDETHEADADQVPYEQSARSTDDRWFTYKQACKAEGREPMTFGEWMRAGQPVPA